MHVAGESQLRSAFDLPGNVQLDASVHWVDDARNQGVFSYWRGDLRVAWAPREDVELALVGQNLFDHARQEFGDFFSVPSSVPRSFYAMFTFRR